MASDHNTTVTKTPVEARQGSTRPNLIYVLGASLILVIAAFAIVWLSTGH
jgi:hypothetical protein